MPRKTLVFLAVCLMLLSGWTTAALAAPERARPAAAFVDSVGVNTHLHHQGTAYDRLFDSVIRPKLIASGIRHVRDTAATHAEAGPDFFYYRRCRSLAQAGIRFNLLTGFTTAHQAGTDYGKLAGVRRWCGDAVVSFEGVNEPDLQPMPPGADWVSETVASQEALYRAVRGSTALAGVSVLGPSVVWSPHAVGDLSGHLDFGNWHPYPGGECPTCGDVYGHDVDFYLPRYRAPSGGKPMIMSESGYHNAVNMPFSPGLHRPASELAAGKYVPRLLLEFFNRGFVRTYLYEFIDGTSDPGRRDPEANFGLLRNDGSEKPAYRAVRSLLGLLRDDGGHFAAGTLDFELGGELAAVHHTLLQKRDGRFFLALWQERRSYDTGARHNAPDDVSARRDLAVPAQRVTVSLASRPTAATVHRLEESGQLSSAPASVADGSLAVSVPDRVTVVELDMDRSAGVPPAATPPAANRAPQLSRVRLTRRVLRRGQATRLRYRLSEPATVSIAIARKGSRRSLRRLQVDRGAGGRSTYLRARARGRALAPGRYVVRVRARDALGARSAQRTVGFRVVRRR